MRTILPAALPEMSPTRRYPVGEFPAMRRTHSGHGPGGFVEKCSRAVVRRDGIEWRSPADSFGLALASAVLHSPSLCSRLCSDQQLRTADPEDSAKCAVETTANL